MSIRFRSSKEADEIAENSFANQSDLDLQSHFLLSHCYSLQFSIGARVRALAHALAGAQARASRRSINPP